MGHVKDTDYSAVCIKDWKANSITIRGFPENQQSRGQERERDKQESQSGEPLPLWLSPAGSHSALGSLPPPLVWSSLIAQCLTWDRPSTFTWQWLGGVSSFPGRGATGLLYAHSSHPHPSKFCLSTLFCVTMPLNYKRGRQRLPRTWGSGMHDCLNNLIRTNWWPWNI